MQKITAWLYAGEGQSPLCGLELSMNISEMLVTISQAAETQPGLFPFPFKMHLIFCCISLVFFLFQFVREKKPYQLIMAIAIPLSLTIWLSENRTLFYAIGIAETVLLLAAFVSSLIFRSKASDEKPAEGEAEAADEAEDIHSQETEAADAEAAEEEAESTAEEE